MSSFGLESDFVPEFRSFDAGIDKLVVPAQPNQSIRWKHQDVTISGTGVTTLNLSDFRLKDSVLTLQGTATTEFIINVTNQFALSNHSAIVLSGGVQLSNVVFNVAGSGQVRIGGDSTLSGMIVARNRTVSLSGGSSISGQVIAAGVHLSRGSSIIPPPVVSQ
jgi:choice-of-anchor A domain-containing protein